MSRFFAPTLGVFEDPVTGSAHCQLVPYWAGVLERSGLTARQLSRRGGRLECALMGDRVRLTERPTPTWRHDRGRTARVLIRAGARASKKAPRGLKSLRDAFDWKRLKDLNLDFNLGKVALYH